MIDGRGVEEDLGAVLLRDLAAEGQLDPLVAPRGLDFAGGRVVGEGGAEGLEDAAHGDHHATLVDHRLGVLGELHGLAVDDHDEAVGKGGSGSEGGQGNDERLEVHTQREEGRGKKVPS